MTKISTLINYLHQIAPPSLQEDYDNAGLITGHPDTEIRGVVVSLDCTESVIDEVIELGYNVVVAHHPIVFRGLKKINGYSYIEKTIIKAIKNDIAIFAIHTNLDNVKHGVNKIFADKIGLSDLKILVPKEETLRKITFFCPPDHVEKICQAMHHAGAGNIGNYGECSFRINGIGTFIPNSHSNPFSGKEGLKSFEDETRIEMIFPSHMTNSVVRAMKINHPFEEVAYYLHTLLNENQDIGAGIIGKLNEPLNTKDFLTHLKSVMDLQVVKHTSILSDSVQTIALCGGSGSFLIKNAIAANADIYISADIKYHEYFDANDQILIVDIGHYESEKYTIELLFSLISNNFSNFAVRSTNVNTNPINFY
jgi:dinuclear metal center YbgI/SA1388 family protein